MLLDGAIAGAAALVAAALCPAALEYAVAGHVSHEAGHALALRHLGLRPLLGLDLRLGEGTGALLALPLVDRRGPGAAGRRHLRLRRGHRQELNARLPRRPGGEARPGHRAGGAAMRADEVQGAAQLAR